MENEFENRYYHGGAGAGNRHTDEKRNYLRDGDFGKEYEDRYKGHDGRNRMDYSAYKSQDRWNIRNESWLNPGESRASRGYGVDDSMRGGYGYDADRNGNDRKISERNTGGYGSGRMGGYSGSAFGGTNYSSHGDFSGNSDYGSMSGGGGNMGLYSSKSGYGNPVGDQQISSERGRSGRGSTGPGSESTYGKSYNKSSGYSGGNTWGANTYGKPTGSTKSGQVRSGIYPANNTYKGYGSNNDRNGSQNYQRHSDRGGYTNYDPNNRWNS